MDEGMYRTMYPTGWTSPKFYGLQEIYKTGTPLRPIVSSMGSVTYRVAKVIAKVLKLLVGKSPQHIQSTSEFVSKFRKVTLLPGECLSSYNVTAMFTSVPIDPVLNIIRDLLEKAETLSNMHVLPVQSIIELLGFYMHNKYSLFRTSFMNRLKVHYQVTSKPYSCYPVHGAFEGEALRSASYPPRYWYSLWMTLGSSNNRPISNFSWITSIA